jgi:hypothetical protein
MGGGRPVGEAWSDAMDGLTILTTENTEITEGGSNGPLQTYFFSLHFSVSSVLSVVNAYRLSKPRGRCGTRDAPLISLRMMRLAEFC